MWQMRAAQRPAKLRAGPRWRCGGTGTPAGTESARLDDLSVQMLMGDGRMKAILVADDDVGPRELLRSAHTTYLTCYQVLRAAGDPQVESVLKQAMPCGSSEQSTPSGEPGFATTSRLIAHCCMRGATTAGGLMGAGEHDADASVASRAFDNRQPTPLRIVRRERVELSRR
jgi:hypothetical protein